MPKSSPLFDEDFLKKLARLKLVVKRILLAGATGEKTSRQKGGRLEYCDHREYTPGDEANYIDWNVFGRTEKLFIKEFSREEEYNVYLVLDLTGSMQPRPSPSNRNGLLKYAKQLTVALGYIALVAGNRLKIIAFSADKLMVSPEFYGEDQIYPVMDFLRPLPAEGKTNLTRTLSEIDRLVRTKGLLVIISDLLDPANSPRGLVRFTNRGFEISIIHLLSATEPRWGGVNLSGWVSLKDTETNQTRTIFISETERRLYRQALNNFLEGWKSFCLKHGIKYFHTDTTRPLEDLIFSFLKKGGLLK